MDEKALSSTQKFSRIVLRIRDHSPHIPWPVKVALVQQVILESNYAKSLLAAKHLNFTGIKWRDELREYADKVTEVTPSEPQGADWCSFRTIDRFIDCYWAFVHRSPYPEVDKYAYINDQEYLRYIWWEGYATDPKYLDKLATKRDEALSWLGKKRELNINGPRESGGSNTVSPDHSTPGDTAKVDWPLPKYEWIPSRKFRNPRRAKITDIIMHYTYSRTFESALNTLTVGSRQASAHWLIGKDGRIAQLVKLEHEAWHAGNANRYSIGIEHVAMPNERLTEAQEKATVALVGWHLKKYGLGYAAITGHQWSGTPTQCPSHLFGPKGTKEELKAWRKKHFGPYFNAGPREAIIS